MGTVVETFCSQGDTHVCTYVFTWLDEGPIKKKNNQHWGLSMLCYTTAYMSFSELHHRTVQNVQFHIHNPKTPANNKSQALLGAMIDFITVNKRQNQPCLYSSQPLHLFPLCSLCQFYGATQQTAAGSVCAFAFAFMHFCVYVSGSNEARDESDMKSIRRCQFGLILMLSSLYTLCITHTHSHTYTHAYTLKV